MGSLLGETIDGRYHLEAALGEGAMGWVFAARDPSGQQVAVKLVRDIDDDLRGPQRFLREVATLNQLVHPNVVELFDFGRDEQRRLSYLVMELISGDPVSKLTSSGRASPALALMVARQAAEGLAGAHRRGIVHRDLKPANLMLVPLPDGSVRVKVLDFGLAFMHADTKLTKTGTAPGTVSYMSPEQLQGMQVDGRADLHALGVILFEMLAGRLPFHGGNQVEIAFAVLNATPRRLDQIVDGVPKELADLVSKLLQKDRDKRPATAEGLVDLIAEFQRRSSLPPVKVEHTGRSTDPVRDWSLAPAVPAAAVR